MPQRAQGEHRVASIGGARVCTTVARAHEVIRIDAAWIAVEPLDMRAGVDTALARVVKVFGEARSHHAYMFLNRRANRLKVFVHDGFGLWLCARRLQQGHFMRPSTHRGERFELSMSQLQAFSVGLPWERLDEYAKISIL
jgi:transposase